MLVLGCQPQKPETGIVLGDGLAEIQVINSRTNTVKLAIDVPNGLAVTRRKLFDKPGFSSLRLTNWKPLSARSLAVLFCLNAGWSVGDLEAFSEQLFELRNLGYLDAMSPYQRRA